MTTENKTPFQTAWDKATEQDEADMIPSDCLDYHAYECEGPVEYRMSMSPTGISYPRCDAHYFRRLDTQSRIVSRYGGQMDYTGYESSWADEAEDY